MEWGVTFLIIFCQASKSCFVLFLSSQERTSAVNTISLGTTWSRGRHICKGHPAEGIPANSPPNPNACHEVFKAEPAYTRWGEPKLFCYKWVRFVQVLIEHRRWIRVLLIWGNQKLIQSFYADIIFNLRETPDRWSRNSWGFFLFEKYVLSYKSNKGDYLQHWVSFYFYFFFIS